MIEKTLTFYRNCIIKLYDMKRQRLGKSRGKLSKRGVTFVCCLWQHSHNGSPRKKEERGRERIFEEIMAQNFPNLIFKKNKNLCIQEAQGPPSRSIPVTL